MSEPDTKQYNANCTQLLLTSCDLFFFCNFADSSLLSRQDERGFTPLMWAAAFGEKAVVDYLLEKVRNKLAAIRKDSAIKTKCTVSQMFVGFFCLFCF